MGVKFKLAPKDKAKSGQPEIRNYFKYTLLQSTQQGIHGQEEPTIGSTKPN
jgi:hypothetical protein